VTGPSRRVQFADELTSHAHLDKVKGDFLSGVRSGVNGTPTFFIDGVRLDAGWDPETLTAALRAAVRAKQ
jgi:protein-disulfide isomerase